MNKDNLFRNIRNSASEEIFDILFKSETIKIERIVSNGQSTPKDEWYDQDTDEWVILLEGSAGIKFENSDAIILINPGDYLYIPAHRKHRVEFTDKFKQSLWIAVHFKN